MAEIQKWLALCVCVVCVLCDEMEMAMCPISCFNTVENNSSAVYTHHIYIVIIFRDGDIIFLHVCFTIRLLFFIILLYTPEDNDGLFLFYFHLDGCGKSHCLQGHGSRPLSS
jgi:hypothetical protein